MVHSLLCHATMSNLLRFPMPISAEPLFTPPKQADGGIAGVHVCVVCLDAVELVEYLKFNHAHEECDAA